MKILFIISIVIFAIFVINYNKMSYKAWNKRCEINSKHPGWYPFCHIDFLKEDPQWFIDNGYEEYIRNNVKNIFGR
jgi:hypothetical protein